MALLRNWPKVVFILVPLSIAVVSGTVLVRERLQPETQKAVRLVKESASRKENFTLQQYLYSTVYHRRSRGEPVVIDGWRAEQRAGPHSPVLVEFNYRDQGGSHAAIWEVEVEQGRVTPKNETAIDLSWH